MPIVNNTKDWEKVFRRQVREIAEGWTVRLSPRSNKITLKVRTNNKEESTILKNNPRYDIAFYFKCSLKKASYRRWLDLKKKIPLKEVKKSLSRRTIMDKKRTYSPLKKVKDAILIRTDVLNKKMMIKKMSYEIDNRFS